ncbi:MAG: hypothetical protein AAGB02_05225 [Pseudomonadota bacterium]
MNNFFLIAAFWCFMIGLIHTFAGSKYDVRPLFDSNVPEPAKSTLFYCWHIVTMTLFAMAAAFLWSGLNPETVWPGIVATVAAGLFAVWGLFLSSMRRLSPLTKLPQGVLFLPLAGIGAWGVF